MIPAASIGVREDKLGWLRKVMAPSILFALFRIVGVMGYLPINARSVFEILRLAAFTIVMASGISVLIAISTGKPEASGLAPVTFLALFGWPIVFYGFAIALPVSLLIPFFITFIVIVSVFSFTRYRRAIRFVVLAAVAVISVSMAVEAPWDRSISSSEFSLPGDTPGVGPSDPDVIIVVLDAYGRADVLSEAYQYDNSELRSQLEQAGFSILPEATANYHVSHLSVGAFLTQEYPATPENPLTKNERLTLTDAIGGNNTLIRTLQATGREYTHVSSPWIEDRCAKSVDHCIRGPILDSMALIWIQNIPFGGPMFFLTMHPFPASAADSLAVLAEAPFASQAPTVMFVHVMSPHIPYMLAADCTRANQRPQGTIREQYACVDKLVADSVANIPDDAIVVIFGDHGPDDVDLSSMSPQEWSDEEIFNRMAVFAAVRLPDHCEYPPDDATLINISRYVSACAIGVDPEPLPNRVFIVPVGYPDSDAAMREIVVR